VLVPLDARELASARLGDWLARLRLALPVRGRVVASVSLPALLHSATARGALRQFGRLGIALGLDDVTPSELARAADAELLSAETPIALALLPRSLVRGIAQNTALQAKVRDTIAAVRGEHVPLVAPGARGAEDTECLVTLGCDWGDGEE
jgi:EAL domain-containing protein (putative c-di-GMP-specific phosphodiesterase class I)